MTTVSGRVISSEPEFVNVKETSNRFQGIDATSQCSLACRYIKKSFRTGPSGWEWIPGLFIRFTNSGSECEPRLPENGEISLKIRRKRVKIAFYCPIGFSLSDSYRTIGSPVLSVRYLKSDSFARPTSQLIFLIPIMSVKFFLAIVRTNVFCHSWSNRLLSLSWGMFLFL